jgi:hypothetical protein
VQATQALGLHLGRENFSGWFGVEWPYDKPTGVWNGKIITGTLLLIQQLRSWLDTFWLASLMDPVHPGSYNSFWETLRDVWLGGLKLDPKLQASCDLDSLSWWRRFHLRWKYGSSPATFSRAVESSPKKCGAIGRKAFVDLASELERVGLDDRFVGQSGTDCFTSIGVSERFQVEDIQPCVRARSAQDLADVRGLDAIMACRESRETPITKGNCRLADKMIEQSDADLQLESKFVGIEHGQDRRYKLSVAHGPGKDAIVEHHEFDVVIVTSPIRDPNLQNDLTRLSTYRKHFFTAPSYPSAYITWFATEHSFSPQYLGSNINADLEKSRDYRPTGGLPYDSPYEKHGRSVKSHSE